MGCFAAEGARMTPPPRRPLNVRLPPDLIEQIEADGGKKQDVVADALRAWFGDANKENGGGRGDDSSDDSKVQQNDSNMIAAMVQQLGEKDQQIAELHVMLQTAITPPPQLRAAPEAEGGRRWWQVWK